MSSSLELTRPRSPSTRPPMAVNVVFFLKRFDSDEGEPPTGRVEVEQERAFLQCHFNRARAHSKLESASSLGAALKEYEYIEVLPENEGSVEYVEGNEDDGKTKADEKRQVAVGE